MQRSMLPLNVYILNLTKEKVAGMRPITSLATFDGMSQNFHPDGLFSTLIFGRVGDDKRSRRYSYIDVKVPILHPVIYTALVKLKRLYGGIISGNEYAVWDAENKDFVRSDPLDGQTGFNFFMSRWQEIKLLRTKSDKRDQAILMIEKYKSIAATTRVLVPPAALRELDIGADGRVREDEINPLYRQLLGVANTISEAAIKSNPEIIDRARYKLQTTFNDIYALFERMIYGKNKLILGKWASRRIMNGTANVITSMDSSLPYLGAPGAVGFNSTVFGLYQTMKGLLPITLYRLRNGFLNKVFMDVNAPARLINKRTLKMENVQLRAAYFDRWATNEGLEKVITSFKEEAIRDRPLEIEGRYIGLIYKGPDNTFRIFQDIGELPANRSKEHVSPITFCELMYLSGYRIWNDYPVFVTRYPITGVGSIYPSMAYVKTTTDAEVRRELGENWEPMGEEYVAREFPVPGAYVNGMSPHPSKLKRMDADFDGDRCSGNFNYSDEAIAENVAFLKLRRAYVGTDGRFISSTGTSTVNLTLHNLTGD